MLRGLIGALLLVSLAGCAGVLPQVERTPSTVLLGAPDVPLVNVARDAGLAADSSGVWPLPQASFGLDARLAMVKAATRSIDLQTYLIADDSTGRMMLRALRDAALRGVRVRLLLDDLYTVDMDRLLLGLAAYPNVDVRLFNPFVTARDSSLRRLVALARGFKRLNHRMHNKLFVADGADALVGGRNLADDYFPRSRLATSSTLTCSSPARCCHN
jgi:cardiolipin synthase C